MEALPESGMEDPYLTDAGGRPIGAGPGACSLDSCISFGLIRGGHLDVTVLGGLQVDERGRLANWAIPGKIGRCHGSCDRHQAGDRCHDPCSERQIQGCEAMHAAVDLGSSCESSDY